MTRELNVKITLSERSNFQKLDDVDYADIIEAAIHAYTTNYQVCVEVLTVTPKAQIRKRVIVNTLTIDAIARKVFTENHYLPMERVCLP